MGLNPARRGAVRFRDRDITRLPPFAIARLGIGYAPEGRQLFAPLTVVQNLRIPFANKQSDRGRQCSSSACSRSSRRSAIAGSRPPAACPAASSRCWRSLARWSAATPSSCSTSPPRAWPRPSLKPSWGVAPAPQARGPDRAARRQNVHTALAVADRAYVLERGEIRFEGPMRDLLEDEAMRRAYLTV